MSVKLLLAKLFKEKGTALTKGQVKEYLHQNNADIPEKGQLKALIQESINSLTSSETSDVEESHSETDNIVVDIKEMTALKAKEIAKKAALQPIKSKSVAKPKNLKDVVSLYPYLKAATISIPYAKLKSMDDKCKYQHVVELLINGFTKAKIELPLENKTTSRYYQCDDRKWTMELCKEVASELELKRELEGILEQGHAIEVPKKRLSRSASISIEQLESIDSRVDSSADSEPTEQPSESEPSSESDLESSRVKKRTISSEDEDHDSKRFK